MGNGRCPIHGGLSTGPRTPEGILRIKLAVTKPCRYTKEAKAERSEFLKLMKACREMLAICEAPPANMKLAASDRKRLRNAEDQMESVAPW